MTFDTIFDRLNSVPANAPFEYVRSSDPFSFDRLPQQMLDRSYCVLAAHQSTDGYLSFAQAELELITIRLLRIATRDVHGVYRQVLSDVSSLVPAVIRDCEGQDFNVELVEWIVPEPVGDEAAIIGEARFTVDWDRQL